MAAGSNRPLHGGVLPPTLLLAAALLFAAPALAVTTKTTVLSVSSAEKPGNEGSFGPASISSSGRYVAFESFSTNLVRRDTNADSDIFVRDRKEGKTVRVSLNSSERQGNDASLEPSISANGRFIAFDSDATNLVSGDDDGILDVFVRDRQKGKTVRVSIPSGGGESDGQSYEPSISADGRFIAFSSDATNLVPNDDNGSTDIFVRDRTAHTTTRVSVSSNGDQGDSASLEAAVSADGRFVTFSSQSVNLIGTDGNSDWDVFIHNLRSGKTTRVSVTSAEAEAHGLSGRPAISADGRFVVFESGAEDLVTSDSNLQDDVFVRDRNKGTTRLVSVSSGEIQGNGLSRAASISASGRYVAFMSDATTFVAADGNSGRDIYLRDRRHGTTRLLSVKTSGKKGNAASIYPGMTPDGRFVVFASSASNLFRHDTNMNSDIFVRGPLH